MTKARDLANAGTALTSVSATELGYLDGVTSAVQTQIDTKAPSSTAATLTGTQTLTNKTLTSPTLTTPVISSIVNTGTLTLPTSTGTVALTSDITVTASSTNTLTNKTISSGILTGTLTANSSAGTNGQVLQSTGTGVQWATPSSGALVLLSTTSLSGSSVTFSNCFNSTYDSYVVYMKNVTAGGVATKGTIALSPTSSYYKGSLMQIDYAGNPAAAQNNNGANPWVTGQITNGQGDTIIWDIAWIGSSGHRFQSYWRQFFNQDPLVYYGGLMSGTTGAKTGFTMGWDGSGSFAQGTVLIYGVVK